MLLAQPENTRLVDVSISIPMIALDWVSCHPCVLFASSEGRQADVT